MAGQVPRHLTSMPHCAAAPHRSMRLCAATPGTGAASEDANISCAGRQRTARRARWARARVMPPSHPSWC
eukprot:scaffold202123_cov40-Tisochrysis_lutea.AAC.1